MNCPQCGAPNESSALRCAFCASPLDAPAPALPASLDALIEQKARAILQEERAQQAARAAMVGVLATRAAQLAAEARRESEARESLVRTRESLAQARVSLAELQRLLARARERRPGLLFMSKGLALFVAILACLLGGVLFPACVEPMVGRSLVAARLLCPAVCEGCHGPGRVFTWHESSNSYEGDVSVQLCHNPQVDIEGLPWSEVDSRSNTDLKSYRLTLWASVPLDALAVFVALMLVAPFAGGRMRRNQAARDCVTYAGAIERTEATIAAKEKELQRLAMTP